MSKLKNIKGRYFEMSFKSMINKWKQDVMKELHKKPHLMDKIGLYDKVEIHVDGSLIVKSQNEHISNETITDVVTPFRDWKKRRTA